MENTILKNWRVKFWVLNKTYSSNDLPEMILVQSSFKDLSWNIDKKILDTFIHSDFRNTVDNYLIVEVISL